MNKNLLALLAIAVSAPSIVSAMTTTDVATAITKIDRHMEDLYNIVGPVYDNNWPKGLKIFEYITTEKNPQIDYLISMIAELASNVLKNEKMRNMLFMIYSQDLSQLAELLMLGNAITIPPLAVPFAEKTLGYDRAAAIAFANAMVDLAAWVQELYKNVYLKYIKGQLDTIFATQQVDAIKAKLNELFASAEVRGIVLAGLLNLKKHWPFIAAKLGEFGFNAAIAERILDKAYAIAKEIEATYMTMPVTAPGVPNIPGVEW